MPTDPVPASNPFAKPSRPRARRLPDWKSLPAPDALLEASVIVPVKDEARRLTTTLRCLAAQLGDDGRPMAPSRFEIIVLANNCTDASAEIVRRYAARRPRLRLYVVEATFPKPVAHIGHARACLMNEACRRLLSVGREGGAIASTDGDTRVAPGWLTATLAEIRAGADAVGGRIVMRADAASPPGLSRYTRRDATYQRLRVQLEHALHPDQADPWPRHHQHFGASLAITPRAYVSVGGLPAEPFLEDEALYLALRRHDIRVRHSERVEVLTSNRQHGRVAVGLSWQLREWSKLARERREAMVPDPAAWAEELRLRRRLQRIWSSRRDGRGRLSPTNAARAEVLAARLRVPPRWLGRLLAANGPFGTVWHEVESRRRRASGQAAPVAMSAAISALRVLLAQQRVRTRRADSVRAASRAAA